MQVEPSNQTLRFTPSVQFSKHYVIKGGTQPCIFALPDRRNENKFIISLSNKQKLTI